MTPAEALLPAEVEEDLRQRIAEVVVASTADLADRIEDDPQQALLQLVAASAAAAEETGRLLREAIGSARHAGHSWEAVGRVLGVSRQAAQQRFGGSSSPAPDAAEEDGAGPKAAVRPARRTLAPVTALDEMAALAEAGRHGWHSVGFGTLHHVLEASAWQWQHRRVVASPLAHRRLEQEGWQRIGSTWFPWAYYARCTEVPAEPEG